MKYGIIFVCQEGLLEIQSAILAVSLKLRAVGDYSITAVVPNFGKVSPCISYLFNQIDVNVVNVVNKFNPFYPEGNKILAASISQNTDRKIFLDSDNICVSSFDVSIFDQYDFYCTCTDPIIALKENEWKSVYNYFKLDIPVFNGLNRIHTQAVVVMFSDKYDFSKRWFKNAMKLNAAVNNGTVLLTRKRQIDQLSLGVSLRMHNFSNPLIDDPMTWNGSDDWWSQPKCKCHPWEREEFIGFRKINKIVATPDMVFGYNKGLSFNLDIPLFLTMQNGANFCQKHQGEPSVMFHNWIDHYPIVRNAIVEIVERYPIIKFSKYWNIYEARYLKNSDNSWFMPNRNDGNFIPRVLENKLWL
jgi:hypothetical protein